MGAYALLIAAPLVYFELSQSPGSNMNVFMLLYGTGWVLFFLYYVSVYTAAGCGKAAFARFCHVCRSCYVIAHWYFSAFRIANLPHRC